MKTVNYQKIVETLENLCVEAAFDLPADVLTALKNASQAESNAAAGNILSKILENAEIAKNEKIPLCQDTGLAVVFIEQGSDIIFQSQDGKTLYDAINDGVANGYEKAYLRKSVVAEPLQHRKNTESNTPCIIHHSVVQGETIKITLMAKGGGCENKSQFKMFNPTAEVAEVSEWILEVVKQAGANACPPFIVGVGLGGNFETSCLISKKALLRNIDSKNPDPFYAQMENDLLTKINALGIGPQGFGGDTTALACLIETAPCHIASLPVAVNIECHSHRHSSVTI